MALVFPCGLGRVDFTEDLCKEPKRSEQWLCAAVVWLPWIGQRRGRVDARKRDAGATRALGGGGKPLGAAWRGRQNDLGAVGEARRRRSNVCALPDRR